LGSAIVHLKFPTLRYPAPDILGPLRKMNAFGKMTAAQAKVHVCPDPRPLGPCRVEIMGAQAIVADQAIAAAWDQLSVDASEPNPFAERWYLAAAVKALAGPHDITIAMVWDGDALIGLMPLQLQSRYAGLPIAHVQNWLNHNAFLGTPLVAKGAERLFWSALLTYFDTAEQNALFLHLCGMATKGPVVEALKEICRMDRRRYAMVHCAQRALLEHGLTPAEYLDATVRGKKRKELRRQHNRLADEGELLFTRSGGSAQLDAWIDAFLALERGGWKGANGSALDCADGTRALFRLALRGAAQAGKLELLDLRLHGQPIAMLVNFLIPPGAFSFKTAFDEDYARFSPGVLLQIENLALLERTDIDWCDSCAAQDHPMIDSLWSGRRTIGRYSVAIGNRTKRLGFAALLTAETYKARLKSK
jgi:CelD/BcsL family acetyltransferase involved in cellulose biosynthesis